MDEAKHDLIIETSLLAGKIMLQSGAETSRVEDTMERIISHALGKEYGENTYTYITVNGIFMKLDKGGTNFVRIDTREHDLEKVTKINQLSRSFVEGKITLSDVCLSLKIIETETPSISLWLKFLCTAVLSGSIMLILGGSFIDLPAAMISGLLAYITYLFLWEKTKKPFISEYMAAFIGGSVGFFITKWFGSNIEIVMIGTVCPLVPGIAITNAIRDMMAKHYLSGLIRALEGIFIGAALGAGIATVYFIFIV